MTNIQSWTPREHIDRACELVEAAEQQKSSFWLELARAHIALANAKMIGRQRA